MADDEEEEYSSDNQLTQQKRIKLRNEFIDDEAELSGDDEISEDEADNSDDENVDLNLVDQDAPELDSDQEEEVRGMYLKQLETEDRRAVLLLREQLEDKNVTLGQRRRRKFKWQNKEIMENSLRRHYDPDDDDSQDDEDDGLDELDYDDTGPRLRRPTAESLLIGSTRIVNDTYLPGPSRLPRAPDHMGASSSYQGGFSDDSNSNAINSRITNGPRVGSTMDMNRFLFRDKEVVEALSTRETIISSREERERVIQREVKRVLQSNSIFDQLYT